jgi:hypothetical protein
MNQQVESGQEPLEPSEPTEQVSEASDAKQTSPAIEGLSAEQLAQVVEIAKREAQSTKDRRFSKQEQKLKSFEEELAEFTELTEGGVSKAVAIKLMNLLGQRASADTPEVLGEQAPQSQPQGGGDDWGKAHESILKAGNLSDNDPEVLALASQHSGDYDGYLASLADLVVKRKARPEATAGAAAQPGGGGASSEDVDLEELTKQLQVYQMIPVSQQTAEDKAEHARLSKEHKARLPKGPEGGL